MNTKILKLLKWLWISMALAWMVNSALAADQQKSTTPAQNAIAIGDFADIWSDQRWFQLEKNDSGEVLYRDQKILTREGAVLSGNTADTNAEIITSILAGGGFPEEGCDMADIATNGSGGCWYYNADNSDITGIDPKKLIATVVKKPEVSYYYHGHFGFTMLASEERHIRDVIQNQVTYGGELRFENLWVRRDFTVYGSLRGQPLICRDLKMNGYGVVYLLSARNIHVEGYFATRQAKIRQNIYIAGRLEAHDLEVGRDLRVIGSASLTRAKFRSGYISLTGAFPIKFTDVNVKSDLTFDREIYCHKPLKVTIDGQSTIQGSIIFKTPGKLILGRNVKIKGKIYNAIMKRAQSAQASEK